jgi:tRNA(fMet)-specific endonuclease VapC
MTTRPAFLPDTNAAVAYLNGNIAIATLLGGGTVFISSIVLGELYFGAENSSRRAENIARVAAFAEGRSIVGCEEPVSRKYGQIKMALRVAGRPIPQNDTWIAAQALHYDLTLITRDNHFNHVAGLSLVGW